MLRWRLLFGTIFIAAFVGICALDYRSEVPGSWLFPLALVAALALAKEMIDLLTSGAQRPNALTTRIGITAVVGSNIPLVYFGNKSNLAGSYHAQQLPTTTFGLCVLIVLAVEIIRYRASIGVLVNAALGLFAIAYIGLLMTAVIQLRVVGGNTTGLVALVSLIAVVKFGDIGAYTVGRLFGKRKMTPVLSPGKTIEGAAGGLLFAVIAACATLVYLPTQLCQSTGYASVPLAMAYGLVVGTAGMLGDLAESLIKREAGRKDSSNVLPGFGGVFDLLDSILFAAPVALLFWISLIV